MKVIEFTQKTSKYYERKNSEKTHDGFPRRVQPTVESNKREEEGKKSQEPMEEKEDEGKICLTTRRPHFDMFSINPPALHALIMILGDKKHWNLNIKLQLYTFFFINLLH